MMDFCSYTAKRTRKIVFPPHRIAPERAQASLSDSVCAEATTELVLASVEPTR
jgi:hypothetical protein